MDLFHKIEGAVAIVRRKNGVMAQTDMYRRGERIFVPAPGGYVRVVTKLGNEFGTGHPDIKVVEFEADGVTLKGGLEPRYGGA